MSAGTLRKNSSKASRPPADAPIPTTGKASPADLDGETGKEGGAGAAGGGTGGMATGARGAIFLAPFGSTGATDAMLRRSPARPRLGTGGER